MFTVWWLYRHPFHLETLGKPSTTGSARFCSALYLCQSPSQVAAEFRQKGALAHGRPELFCCLGGVSHLEHGHPQDIMEIRIVRAQPQHLLILLDSLVDQPPVHACLPEV